MQALSRSLPFFLLPLITLPPRLIHSSFPSLPYSHSLSLSHTHSLPFLFPPLALPSHTTNHPANHQHPSLSLSPQLTSRLHTPTMKRLLKLSRVIHRALSKKSSPKLANDTHITVIIIIIIIITSSHILSFSLSHRDTPQEPSLPKKIRGGGALTKILAHLGACGSVKTRSSALSLVLFPHHQFA